MGNIARLVLALSALMLMIAFIQVPVHRFSAQGGGVLLWSVPDQVFDIAVSDDGSVVAAAVQDSEGYKVKVFAASGEMLWEWGTGSYRPTAVALSGSGSQLAVALYRSTGSRVHFFDDVKGEHGMPLHLWWSANLYGPIGPNALAISRDGNHVLAVGTGPNVFYWNDTRSLAGPDIASTWHDYEAPWQLEYAAISDDGGVVLAAAYNADTHEACAYYYLDSTSSTGPRPYSIALFMGNSRLAGAALSGSGNVFVLGVNPLTGGGKLYYFVYNTSCPSIHLAYWEMSFDSPLAAVDLSHDEEVIVAATNTSAGTPGSITIIRGMRDEVTCIGTAPGAAIYISPHTSSEEPSPSAVIMEYSGASSHTTHGFTYVSIDNSGSVVAAGTGDMVFAVRGSDASLLWTYSGEYPLVSMIVEVTGSGEYIASGGAVFDSLYFFSVHERPVGGRLAFQGPAAKDHILLAAATMMIIASMAMLVSRRLKNH